MTGLVKRGAVFYIRVRVPSDLLNVFDGRRDFWKSLKTTSEQEARRLCPVLAGRIQQCFLLMRSGMLSEKQMRHLASGLVREGLNMFESWRFGKPPDAEASAWNAIHHDAFPQMMKELREDIAASCYDRILPALDGVLAKQSILQLAKGSDEYNALARHFAIAVLQLLEVEGERRKGNYANSFDRARYDLTETRPNPQPTLPDKPASSAPLISKVIADYIAEKEAEAWDVKTRQQNESTLSLMLEIIGDQQIRGVNHQHMMGLRDTLKRLPPNRTKTHPDVSIEAVLRLKNLKPMSTTTVNNLLTRISSFWHWAEIHEHVLRSPAHNLLLPTSKRADEERKIYTDKELQLLLNTVAEQARPTSHPERIWIVLIALYGGMRPNEIAQLYLDDVVTEDGVLCFRVNDTHPDQKVKNKSARRIVPVHPILLEYGFERYVKSINRNSTGRLFPKLHRHRDGYHAYIGRWLQDVNRDHVTKEREKTFYSCRHNFSTALKQAEVEQTLISELMGHAIPGETLGRYAKAMKPSQLLAALRKLDYGLDMAKIKAAAMQTHRNRE